MLQTLIADVASGEILGRLYFSLYLIAIGLGLAIATAAAAAVLALCSPIVSDWVQAVMAILHPLPGISVLPIIILWLGTGGPINYCSDLVFLRLAADSKFAYRPAFSTHHPNRSRSKSGLQRCWVNCQSTAARSLPPYFNGSQSILGQSLAGLCGCGNGFGASGGEGGLGWFIYKKTLFHGNRKRFWGGIIVIIIVGLIVERLFFEWIEASTVRRWGGMTSE